MKRIDSPDVVRLPCPACPDDGRGRTQESAEAALRRHLAIAHGITDYVGKDAYKRTHAALVAGRARGERPQLERIIAPRGGKKKGTGNFDAHGAAALIAALPRRPVASS